MYSIGVVMTFRYIENAATCVMATTGMNLLLYNNGRSMGKPTIKSTSMGESRSRDTSICWLTVVFTARLSALTAESRGK